MAARSFIRRDQVRIFAAERLPRRRGSVTGVTLAEVEYDLPLLLDL